MNVEPPQRGFKTFILLLALGTGSFLITKMGKAVVTTLSQASTTAAPEEVRVTNIGATSVTVTWTTSVPTTEYLLYRTGTSAEEKAFSPHIRQNHHLTLEQLLPNTEYQFRIGSGTKIYSKKGAPFTFTTAYNTPPGRDFRVFGQVVDLRQEPVSNALVFLTIKDADRQGSPGISTTLSDITNTNGLFSINLQEAKERSLKAPFSYSSAGQDQVEVSVFGESGETASVLLTTNQLQPTPLLQLSPERRLLDLRGEEKLKGAKVILPPQAKGGFKGEHFSEKLLRWLVR